MDPMGYNHPMVTLTISNTTTLIDEASLPLVEQYCWTLHTSSANQVYVRGYRKGENKNKKKYLHRILLDAKPGEIVDHKNGDRLDNRMCNLRICTSGQNAANRHVVQSKTSNFKGVHFEQQTGRWRSEINFKHKKYRLGRFDTQEEAAAAYARKAVALYGEFANPASNAP